MTATKFRKGDAVLSKDSFLESLVERGGDFPDVKLRTTGGVIMWDMPENLVKLNKSYCVTFSSLGAGIAETYFMADTKYEAEYFGEYFAEGGMTDIAGRLLSELEWAGPPDPEKTFVISVARFNSAKVLREFKNRVTYYRKEAPK